MMKTFCNYCGNVIEVEGEGGKLRGTCGICRRVFRGQVNTVLSPRQALVVHELAQGKSCKEIAQQTGITLRTVMAHIAAAKAQLEAATIAGMIGQAFAQGVLVVIDGEVVLAKCLGKVDALRQAQRPCGDEEEE